MEWLPELRSLRRHGMFDVMKQRMQLSRTAAWRNVIANAIIESKQADCVALVIRKIGETGREHFCVVCLLHITGSITHGSAHIEDDQNARVRFALVQLHEQFIAASINIPVDATNFIAGLVLPILCKIDAEPKIGRLMQPGDESFDNGSRQQLHILNADQNLGIDESIPGSVNYGSAQV